MYLMRKCWLHNATFQETEPLQHSPWKNWSNYPCCPAEGGAEPPPPILRGHKGGDEKEANLPSIVLASRHGKSYFVTAQAGVRRRETTGTASAVYWWYWKRIDPNGGFFFIPSPRPTGDAQRPVYKENTSFSLSECGAKSHLQQDTITHPPVIIDF